jgi:NAD-dependent deacetylase
MEERIKQAAQIIKQSKYTVAFTGAGISVESGIPPFRGPQGLWSKYDPIVLDIDYFYSNSLEAWKVIRELFYDFFGKANPNPGHLVLAEWEHKGYIKSVITQNIDSLHQQAGSKVVYEFHGTADILVCTKCGKKHQSKHINLNVLPPGCLSCNGLLKPDFIFFGEGIPHHASTNSFADARKSDVFIVIGTTGEVMPASMLPFTAKEKGSIIIEINPEISNFTNNITDIYLKGKAGEILPKINDFIKNEG